MVGSMSFLYQATTYSRRLLLVCVNYTIQINRNTLSKCSMSPYPSTRLYTCTHTHTAEDPNANNATGVIVAVVMVILVLAVVIVIVVVVVVVL